MTLEFDPPLDPEPHPSIALIGPPKTGKTGGAASGPGPVLYLNADLETRTRFARRTYGDKVKFATVKGRQTLADAIHEAYSGNWGTVAVDPLGEVFRTLLEERLGGHVPETMNNHVLNAYRVVGDEIERFCRKLAKAPVVSVFVFHEVPIRDEDSGAIERLPWTGTTNTKIGRAIMGFVDIVGFTGKDGDTYVAQLVPAKGRNGGDGFDCLADERGLRKLDLSEWVEAIKANEGLEVADATA